MTQQYRRREISDLVIQNVTKFLQTVVVIDDQAWLNQSSCGAPQTPEDPEDLDAKTLIDGFANDGIACAVLLPYSADDELTQATNLVESADIVVLDWIIRGDNGRKAREIIRRILQADDNSDRMRLIVIYTGERNLNSVAARALAELNQHLCGETENVDGFTFQSGSVRLAILAKEHTPVDPLNLDVASRRISIPELPGRLIREFASMTEGMLPNVAVAGLSAIRSQTHKLLSKFSSNLDPAYIGHRALLDNPSDAEDHVVSMLVTEIWAILENGNVTEPADIQSIRSWIDQMSTENPIRFNLLPSRTNNVDDVIELLTTGIEDGEYDDFIDWGWGNLTHAFVSNTEADSSNREFAMMLHLKTRYGDRRPALTLGTILYSDDDTDSSYWICLQPKCDSVRIKTPRAFPMIRLRSVVNHRSVFDIVVKRHGASKLLYVPRKPLSMTMVEFGNIDPPTEMILAEQVGSNWQFNSVSGATFEWLGELKDEHAQRLANEFAATFARVGVNEAEWVRRSGVKRR